MKLAHTLIALLLLAGVYALQIQCDNEVYYGLVSAEAYCNILNGGPITINLTINAPEILNVNIYDITTEEYVDTELAGYNYIPGEYITADVIMLYENGEFTGYLNISIVDENTTYNFTIHESELYDYQPSSQEGAYDGWFRWKIPQPIYQEVTKTRDVFNTVEYSLVVEDSKKTYIVENYFIDSVARFKFVLNFPPTSSGKFNITVIADGESYVIDPWWNSAWLKKRSITISNYGQYPLVDYRMPINITYDSDMQPDFSDIRFVNGSENEELSYWIESKVDGNWAYVWVRIPNIPVGDSNIYVYYKNITPVSSVSNRFNTMIYGKGANHPNFVVAVNGSVVVSEDSSWFNVSAPYYTLAFIYYPKPIKPSLIKNVSIKIINYIETYLFDQHVRGVAIITNTTSLVIEPSSFPEMERYKIMGGHTGWWYAGFFRKGIVLWIDTLYQYVFSECYSYWCGAGTYTSNSIELIYNKTHAWLNRDGRLLLGPHAHYYNPSNDLVYFGFMVQGPVHSDGPATTFKVREYEIRWFADPEPSYSIGSEESIEIPPVFSVTFSYSSISFGSVSAYTTNNVESYDNEEYFSGALNVTIYTNQQYYFDISRSTFSPNDLTLKFAKTSHSEPQDLPTNEPPLEDFVELTTTSQTFDGYTVTEEGYYYDYHYYRLVVPLVRSDNYYATVYITYHQ